ERDRCTQGRTGDEAAEPPAAPRRRRNPRDREGQGERDREQVMCEPETDDAAPCRPGADGRAPCARRGLSLEARRREIRGACDPREPPRIDLGLRGREDPQGVKADERAGPRPPRPPPP